MLVACGVWLLFDTAPLGSSSAVDVAEHWFRPFQKGTRLTVHLNPNTAFVLEVELVIVRLYLLLVPCPLSNAVGNEDSSQAHLCVSQNIKKVFPDYYLANWARGEGP